jgi:crotonobetainyl-CoA:carnitine CoA-transferase CaiB-like acyl-CoA transferase
MPKTAISAWPASPSSCPRTPSKMVARPPEFGEQTEEVLAEFGFTAKEIEALRL